MSNQCRFIDNECEYATLTCDPKDRIVTICNHPDGQKDVSDMTKCPLPSRVIEEKEPKKTSGRKKEA